jgi:HAE1 family hydrophobic/amphiphilic exporter-1
VQGSILPGFSTGQAIAAMERIAAENLPSGFRYEWTEIALQEKVAGNTAIVAFTLAVVFVFQLLAAQYESVLLPLAVILIAPMCSFAAISGVLLCGMDNNILTQIGVDAFAGARSRASIPLPSRECAPRPIKARPEVSDGECLRNQVRDRIGL